jgi:PEP-CTERM motif
MKRTLLVSLILCFSLVFCTTAWSLTVPSGPDVGNIDTLVAFVYLGNSGEQFVLDWVNEKLGSSYSTLTRTTNQDPLWSNWQQTVEDNSSWAFKFLTGNPEYFLIKIGNSNATDLNMFLYRNVSALDWGVISLHIQSTSTDPNIDITLENFGKLSHIDEFGGTAVPEPTTLLLLGVGLVGLAGVMKFRK